MTNFIDKIFEINNNNVYTHSVCVAGPTVRMGII